MPPKASKEAAPAPPPAPPPVVIPELPRGARWVPGAAPAAWGVTASAEEALKLYTPRRLFRHDFLLICRLMGLFPHPAVLQVDAPAPGLGEPESAVRPLCPLEAEGKADDGSAEGEGEPEELFFKLDPSNSSVSLRNATLSAHDFDAFLAALSVSTNIKSLAFFNVGLTVQQVGRLGDVLTRRALPQLISLTLDCNEPGEGGWWYVPPSSSTATTPAPPPADAAAATEGTVFQEPPVHALARLLDRSTGSTLATVSFRSCGLGPADGRPLGEALRFNSACRDLLLSNNKLGDEGAIAVLAGVRDNKGLERLSLAGNGLTASAAGAVAATLSSGRISGVEARALVKAEVALVEAVIKAEYGAAAFEALAAGGAAPAAGGRPGSGGKTKPPAGKGAPPPGPDPAVAATAAALKLRVFDTIEAGTPPAPPAERPPTPKSGKSAPAPQKGKDAPPPPPPAPWERFNDDGVYRAWGCPTLQVLDISGNTAFGLTPVADGSSDSGPGFGFRSLLQGVVEGLALPAAAPEGAAPAPGGDVPPAPASTSAPLHLRTLVASRCVPAGLRLEQGGGAEPTPLALHTEHSGEVLVACGVEEAVAGLAALGATLVTGITKVA